MHRYPNNKRFTYVMKSNRIWPPIIIVALLAIAFLVYYFVGRGGLDEANFENHRNARLRNETQYALSQTNSLSRLGATSTAGALGRIRQYVHGVEVINELNVSMYGEVGRLYRPELFDDIYRVIDEYEAKLSTGQKVNETLAALAEAIERLNVATTTVLGF